MTRGAILLHVVNHATYHRGWIAEMFFQVPATTPTTDLPVFLAQRGRAGLPAIVVSPPPSRGGGAKYLGCFVSYSATVSPEPPNSAGKSFSLGRPSFIRSTVSA